MTPFEKLVGKKINRILMSQDYLRFETDKGDFSFSVFGDCCSHSYFYDFYGVQKLLDNGPVKQVEAVDLTPGDFNTDSRDDYIQCYGFSFTTESPEFGDVTSVFSFRNSSNGYYGGWVEDVEVERDTLTDGDEITDDIVDICKK